MGSSVEGLLMKLQVSLFGSSLSAVMFTCEVQHGLAHVMPILPQQRSTQIECNESNHALL